VALSMRERQAITREMGRRYRRSGKRERGLMLDELCALTGYNRTYAARRLRARARGPAPPARKKRVRERTYTSELLPALRKVSRDPRPLLRQAPRGGDGADRRGARTPR